MKENTTLAFLNLVYFTKFKNLKFNLFLKRKKKDIISFFFMVEKKNYVVSSEHTPLPASLPLYKTKH